MQTVALQSAQINALLTWELPSIYTSALARRVSLFPHPPQESWASRHDATAPSGHWFIPRWDEDIQLATYGKKAMFFVDKIMFRIFLKTIVLLLKKE